MEVFELWSLDSKKKKNEREEIGLSGSLYNWETAQHKIVLVTTFTTSTHGSSPLAFEMFSSTLVDPKALYWK